MQLRGRGNAGGVIAAKLGGFGIPSTRESGSAAQLIYVADHNSPSGDSVDLYSYPNGKQRGELRGFGFLYGDCADSHGDVFVVNAASPSTIIEYPRGGKTPIKVFYDFGYTPTGCSVDPKTGNLAVANFYANNYTSGTIAIFTRIASASGPMVLTAPNIFSARYCGYDASGNLYVDGYAKSLQILLADYRRAQRSSLGSL